MTNDPSQGYTLTGASVRKLSALVKRSRIIRVETAVDDSPPPRPTTMLVKSPVAVAKGAWGEFEHYVGPTGSETATGDKFDCYCRARAYVADKWAYADMVNDVLEVIPIEC